MLDTENITREMFRLIVLGNPIPKARARVTKRGTHTPKRTRDYEKLVRDLAALTWRGPPLTGRIAVTFHFYRDNKRRVDLDNLSKACLDSLQEVVFKNDSQVDVLHAEKHVDRKDPRVEITVEEITDE